MPLFRDLQLRCTSRPPAAGYANAKRTRCESKLSPLVRLAFAERTGFEPVSRFRRLHAFQACLFSHSSIFPMCSTNIQLFIKTPHKRRKKTHLQNQMQAWHITKAINPIIQQHTIKDMRICIPVKLQAINMQIITIYKCFKSRKRCRMTGLQSL